MAYTPKIEKETIRAIIRTTTETIEGMVYKRPQHRLLDALNLGDDQFIAVTDAKIYSGEDGELTYETDIIAVNKNHIVLITGGAIIDGS